MGIVVPSKPQQPDCEQCVAEADPKVPTRKADYFSPKLALDLCMAHGITTGALTSDRCWPWNDHLGRFDRD